MNIIELLSQLSERSTINQLVWVYLLGTIKENCLIIDYEVVRLKFKLNKKAIYRIVSDGVECLKQNNDLDILIVRSTKSYQKITFKNALAGINNNQPDNKGAQITIPLTPNNKEKKANKTLQRNIDITAIVRYLNQATNKSYRPTTAITRKHISGRLDEGYTVNDFIKVIDNKVSQWKGDPVMEPYLRPETLFGPNHFEGYLNQNVATNETTTTTTTTTTKPAGGSAIRRTMEAAAAAANDIAW